MAVSVKIAPAYDPTFRLPDHLARQERPAAIARHEPSRAARRPIAPAKSNTSVVTNSSVSDDWPNLAAIIQRLSQPVTSPLKVMLPADK